MARSAHFMTDRGVTSLADFESIGAYSQKPKAPLGKPAGFVGDPQL